MIGQRFGRWIVIAEGEPIVRSYPGRAVHNSRRMVCRCDCGTEKECEAIHLRSGRSSSCGCLRRELVSKSMKTHGATVGGKTSEYTIWKGMRRRCQCSTSDDFPRYGGRGIKVCERWNDYANFIADMGPRPSRRHSLDRFPNNDGDYEPTNCRWATDAEQSRNKSTNRIVQFRGHRMVLVDACKLAGIKYQIAIDRLDAGWPVDRALTERPSR